ncbi:hypothetical protein P256_00604 [Acinetobacter nectaris CIP 110549]|uniref:Uncharacterized protein n=1 Tax=Acinetobacter nectaris CIP 110549 TaxID=1392540 RepID=V2UXX0_9GAMM|nr:DUF4405 domain-containing protein [Acinetobacter nectaris]ESK40164.1 hypothetical protein P256_00604 [Acinetobacter nectaris CIP 110549]
MKVSIRLPKIQQTSLYVVWTILSITGLYFAYTQDWKMYDPSVWTTYTLKLHGICASLMLILIGTLIPIHIQLSLEVKRNIKSGIPMLVTMLLLAFSGVALYYSGEAWMATAKMVHIWIGILVIIILPVHIFLGRKRKKIKKESF